MVKRMGNMVGPPKTKKMTIFVDDINAPLKTEWGDQITSETFRQLIELKGFYSVEKPGDFCTVLDTQVMAVLIKSVLTKVHVFRSVFKISNADLVV